MRLTGTLGRTPENVSPRIKENCKIVYKVFMKLDYCSILMLYFDKINSMNPLTLNRVNCLLKNSYFHKAGNDSGLLYYVESSCVYACSPFAPTDTFNTVTVTDIDKFNEKNVVEQAKSFYGEKNLPMSVWLFQEKDTSSLEILLKDCGFVHAETFSAMSALLSKIEGSIVPSKDVKEIKKVSDVKGVEDFCAVMSPLWDPPCPHLLTHLSSVSSLLLREGSPLSLYVAYDCTGRPVGSGSIQHTPEDPSLAGIYDIATVQEQRGKGIGSHMLSYLLSILKKENVETVVLQASSSGQSIYKKLGFNDDGLVLEFSNNKG